MTEWQRQKDTERRMLTALLQRVEGEPFVIDGNAWRVAGWNVEESDPDEGPHGFVSVVCDAERRHVDWELSCCAFGVVRSME